MEVKKHGGTKLENSGKKPKVAVLMGGIGSEREISFQSGNSVADALRQAGFDIVTDDINPNNLEILEDKSIDVFFPALHGEFGEDGHLQQIFEEQIAGLHRKRSGRQAERHLTKSKAKDFFSKQV